MSTSTYVNLGSVRTWYDEHGSGEALVLLHPALTDASAFGDLAHLRRRTLVMVGGDDEVT